MSAVTFTRRVEALERSIGTAECTCRDNGGLRLSVRIHSRVPDGGVLKIPRRVCPQHGPARVIAANLTPYQLCFVDVQAPYTTLRLESPTKTGVTR